MPRVEELPPDGAAAWGRKATVLGSLRRAGLPVPEAIAMAADAPGPEVVAAWRELGGGTVAVRSSAPGEDADDRSLAGRYTTVLDVCDEPSLLLAHARLGEIPCVIQVQVDAAVAGVAFSRAPDDPDTVLIQVVRGPLARLVQGAARPSVCAVPRWDAGGARWRDRADGARFPLEPLLGLLQKVEVLQGGAQDVEWALDGAGGLWLLQARPITGPLLPPAPSRWPLQWQDPADAAVPWRQEVEHVFQTAACPLAASGAETLWIALLRGRQLPDGEDERWLCGRPFHRVRQRRRGSVPDPRAQAWLSAYGTDAMRRWRHGILPYLTRRFRWCRDLPWDQLPAERLAIAVAAAIRISDAFMWIHFHVLFSRAKGDLGRFLAERLGVGADEAAGLTLGAAHATAAIDRALYAQLRHEDLDAFVAEFGDRPILSDDWSLPTWRERPEHVAEVLTAWRERTPEDPDARLRRLRGQRKALARQLMGRIDEPEDRVRFLRLWRAALREAALMEDHNFAIDQWREALLHYAFAALGRHLARAGLIPRPDDVWSLYVDEALTALVQRRPVDSGLHWRHALRSRWRRLSLPVEVGGGAPAAVEACADWRGEPASPGLGSGPARVVLTLEDLARLRPGDVLVTQVLLPPLAQAAYVAAAIVSEGGAALSHGGILAREAGIPAVVAVDGLLGGVRDGDWLEVDGAAGTVRIAPARKTGTTWAEASELPHGPRTEPTEYQRMSDRFQQWERVLDQAMSPAEAEAACGHPDLRLFDGYLYRLAGSDAKPPALPAPGWLYGAERQRASGLAWLVAERQALHAWQVRHPLPGRLGA